MQQNNLMRYVPTDVANNFHWDRSKVRLLLGPVGCGKSVACCEMIMMHAFQQQPGNDGIRRSKWAIIRNTYPELKATTIATWRYWFPEDKWGPIKWSSPITHHIKRGDVDIEVIFLALDSITDIKKLMSFELTGIYINEMQFIPKGVFDICLQRLNRFPPKTLGAPITFTGLIADTNPPDSDHWIYKLFEEKTPDDFKLYKYQPALIKVENVPNDCKYSVSLDGSIYITNPSADYTRCPPDPEYWLKLVSGYRDEQIKVYLQGDYGTVIDGRAVHPEYNRNFHKSSRNLLYNKHLPLLLSFDFGLTPACCISQISASGQLLVLAEVWTEYMGLRQFVSTQLLPLLNTRFSGWLNNHESVHDPAGQSGAQTDEKTCQDILWEHKIKSYPARTNDATSRREGAKWWLNRLQGGQPGMLVDPSVVHLDKALAGKYQYARIKVAGDERFHDVPQKNIYSHIAEAWEYRCMHSAYIDQTPRKKTNYDLASRVY